MKKKKEGKKLFLSDLVLIPICLIFLYPFYYLVINTFKPMTEMSFNPVAFPKTLFLDNYKDIFSQAQIYRAFGNTLIITVCSVLLIVVIGEMAAYPIVFNANKLNNAFMVYLMIGFLVPFQAILLSLFEVMQAETDRHHPWHHFILLQWLGTDSLPRGGLYANHTQRADGSGHCGRLQRRRGIFLHRIPPDEAHHRHIHHFQHHVDME